MFLVLSGVPSPSHSATPHLGCPLAEEALLSFNTSKAKVDMLGALQEKLLSTEAALGEAEQALSRIPPSQGDLPSTKRLKTRVALLETTYSHILKEWEGVLAKSGNQAQAQARPQSTPLPPSNPPWPMGSGDGDEEDEDEEDLWEDPPSI